MFLFRRSAASRLAVRKFSQISVRTRSGLKVNEGSSTTDVVETQIEGMSGYRGRGRGNGRGRHPRYSADYVIEGVWNDNRNGNSSGQVPFRHHRGRGGKRIHPPGLAGAEIGLFYAAKQKGKKEREKAERRHMLNMSPSVEQKIAETLRQLDRSGIASPPSCSNVEFRKDYMQNLAGNIKDDGCGHNAEPIPLENFRNAPLDALLKNELTQRKFNNDQYKMMRQFRKQLPVFSMRKEISEAIIRNQVTVISGETGSGKTTQIPQYILDRAIADGNGSICNILCTQPRRISAITVAERVAEERGEPIGGKTVGYSIRLDHKPPTRTGGTLNFLVNGILLQRLRSDPLLTGISHVIVDEVHERDNLNDFALVILKDLIKKRTDLKVVLMSATLNAEKFSEYFGGCAMFHIAGTTYPVIEYYLEDIVQTTKFVFPPASKNFKDGRTLAQIEFRDLVLPYVRKLLREKSYSMQTTLQLGNPSSEELNYDLIQATLELIVARDDSNGAVLIFVPGWTEISTLIRQLEDSGKFRDSEYVFYPLHSMVPIATQRQTFKRPPAGVRKIIVATNIAETSITIDDIRFVIDTGKVKQKNFDIDLNLETLDDEWVSKANAQQRRGRAGRVQAGVCYYLYSRGRQRILQDFKPPEIQRSKLEEQILLLKNLRFGNAEAFFQRFMDPPSKKAVDLGLDRLRKIGALGSLEHLSPLGFHLSKLPMDPYTGKMILMAAIFSCLDPILTCAASISYKDCFQIPLGHEQEVDKIRFRFAGETRSDHMAVIRAVQGYEEAKRAGTEGNYCYSNYLSHYTLRHLEGLKEQFAQSLYDMKFVSSRRFKDPALNRNSENTALIKAIIASGLYPNLATMETKMSKSGELVRAVTGFTHEDGTVRMHQKSVNSGMGLKGQFESPFFVYFKKMRIKGVALHDSTMVTPFPLLFFGGELDYLEDSGFGSLGIDGLTRFRSTFEIYKMISDLRTKLDEVLENKIQNPGPTCWEEKPGTRKSSERLLLEAMRDLLTNEYTALMTDQDVEPGKSGWDTFFGNVEEEDNRE